MATRYHNQTASRILWQLPLKSTLLTLMVSFMWQGPDITRYFLWSLGPRYNKVSLYKKSAQLTDNRTLSYTLMCALKKFDSKRFRWFRYQKSVQIKYMHSQGRSKLCHNYHMGYRTGILAHYEGPLSWHAKKKLARETKSKGGNTPATPVVPPLCIPFGELYTTESHLW